MESIRIQRFKYQEEELFEAARTIRDLVFVQEQEVDEREEFDEFESSSEHYLLYLNEKPIATARWRKIGDKTKLERFALLKEYRNQGHGGKILSRVIKDAKETQQTLYMHAQLKAIPFYERQGFKAVGEMFSECDIDHYKMVMEV